MKSFKKRDRHFQFDSLLSWRFLVYILAAFIPSALLVGLLRESGISGTIVTLFVFLGGGYIAGFCLESMHSKLFKERNYAGGLRSYVHAGKVVIIISVLFVLLVVLAYLNS